MLILRLQTVKGRNGEKADASVYNKIREGLFPPGVAIGTRARGWPDYEVDAINAARIAGKSDDEIRELVTDLVEMRVHIAGKSDDEIRAMVRDLTTMRRGKASADRRHAVQREEAVA
jgi:prophage regulatory protein